jgi:hypothetical protein
MEQADLTSRVFVENVGILAYNNPQLIVSYYFKLAIKY